MSQLLCYRQLQLYSVHVASQIYSYSQLTYEPSAFKVSIKLINQLAINLRSVYLADHRLQFLWLNIAGCRLHWINVRVRERVGLDKSFDTTQCSKVSVSCIGPQVDPAVQHAMPIIRMARVRLPMEPTQVDYSSMTGYLAIHSP